MRMRLLHWPADRAGDTFYTLGSIEEDRPNVISLLATAGSCSDRGIGRRGLRVAKTLEPDVVVEEVLRV
jgi:hypothetical protein